MIQKENAQVLVTVVVPAYNAGKDLRPAVDSVLSQTYKNIEILVIDDGSTDNSIESLSDIKDKRLRIVRQENAGKSVAMNHAISIMNGEYLLLQDADDLSYATRVSDMVEVMQSKPELGMLFSGYDLIIEDKKLAPTFSGLNTEDCRKMIKAFKMPGHDPTAMTRADIAKEFLYNPNYRVAQGLDFILRVGEKYSIMRLNKCLYSYRISFKSATRSNIQRRRTFVRQVIRSAYLRRQMALPFELSDVFDSQTDKGINNSDLDNNLAAHFMNSVVDQKLSGRLFDSIKTGLICSKIHFFDMHYQKALIYSLLPIKLVKYIRFRKSPIKPYL